jgi:hypothetical protein
VVVKGSISAQQTAASCRRQRARAVTATTESRQKHARTSVLAALPLPRYGESAAADLAASYTGLHIPVLPIECAWTHASAISMGAVAVFRAFSTYSPAAFPRRLHGRARAERSEIIYVFTIYKTLIYTYFRRASLASCRRLAQWKESLVRWPVSRDRIPPAPIGYCIFRSRLAGAQAPEDSVSLRTTR